MVYGGRFRGAPYTFNFCVMINSCEKMKKINSFQYVAIPSPRDVFNRYGERVSARGEYSSSGEQVSPSLVSSSSVIDQLINAQEMLENDCKM